MRWGTHWLLMPAYVAGRGEHSWRSCPMRARRMAIEPESALSFASCSGAGRLAVQLTGPPNTYASRGVTDLLIHPPAVRSAAHRRTHLPDECHFTLVAVLRPWGCGPSKPPARVSPT